MGQVKGARRSDEWATRALPVREINPMNMTLPIVVVQDLVKDYGQRRAVDGVSFQIEAGEVLGLLGPNGSGKSTILKILTGYLAPTAGKVEIVGYDLARDGARARQQLGYVPEDATLYSHMRVDEFLRCMGGLKGLKGRALAEGMSRVVDDLGLGGVRRMPIGKLSRGFRQRVAIAQALINSPALLILDEPTNGLDPQQVIEVRELIKRLAPLHTVLVTSHVLGEIERVATRVAILLDGKLLTASAEASLPLLLSVRARPPATGAALSALLATAPGVEAVRAMGDPSALAQHFELRLRSREAIPVVAAALHQAGASLLELQEVRADLEALFLDLTQRQRR